MKSLEGRSDDARGSSGDSGGEETLQVEAKEDAERERLPRWGFGEVAPERARKPDELEEDDTDDGRSEGTRVDGSPRGRRFEALAEGVPKGVGPPLPKGLGSPLSKGVEPPLPKTLGSPLLKYWTASWGLGLSPRPGGIPEAGIHDGWVRRGRGGRPGGRAGAAS